MEHKCDNCQGKLDIICCKCNNKFYLECFEQRKEIQELILLINKLTTTKTKTTTKIKNMFGTESLFSFTCQICKTNSNENVEHNKTEASEFERKIIEEYNEKLQIVDQKYSELDKKYENELQRNTKLEMEMNQIINQRDTLMNETDKILTERDNIQKKCDIMNKRLNMRIDNDIGENSIIISDGEKVVDLITQLNDFQINMTNTMKDQMVNLAYEMEARIRLECEKIGTKINIKKKGKKTSTNKEKTSLLRQCIDKIDITNDSSEKDDKNNQENEVENNINTEYPKNGVNDYGGMLKPPPSNRMNDKGIYEIHISKFHAETTERSIEEFITNKTSINNDHFMVEKLNGFRDKNYASFKVTTLKESVYMMIIDSRLWSPVFKARDFQNKTMIRKNQNGRYQNGNEYKQDWNRISDQRYTTNNKYSNQSPSKTRNESIL